MAKQTCCNHPMTTAADRLQRYLNAEAAILDGQSVRFSDNGVDRTLTRADLASVQAEISKLERRVAAENRMASGGSSPRYQTPDFS